VNATTVLGGAGYSRELVAELVRATEAAAEAARPWAGKGDKDAADGAAVAAMRAALTTAPFDGTVVIGEGEKDAAPMLANGERLGSGGPACDIAVDPLDGTRLVADGVAGAIAIIALAPRGSMFDPRDVFYMDKIISAAVGRNVLDIGRPAALNLAALATARGAAVEELTVVILDKPRHATLIAEVRETGASVRLVAEGDVAAAVAAATMGSGIDLMLGVGGTPEGIVTACAVRALGGFMQGRLAPQSDAEHDSAVAAGHRLDRVFELDELVTSESTLFIATEV